jgi:3-phosphoshikimate 1-carboxyvinyltransferase
VGAPLSIANGPIRATVEVPGSKSVANRALICAALAPGRSTVHHVATGDDTRAMLDGLGRLGVGVEQRGTTVVWRARHRGF